MTPSKRPVTPFFLCTLAAVVMAYGWGYRGITGSERGAMIAGAMLSIALCLGSNRPDWHRRAVVAGFFGAVGWAWGGSFSYMEQTFYTVSDSFPDVFYGYSCLFLLGGLWAGIGGAVLGLTFTLSRSRLQRFMGPFIAMATVLFIVNMALKFIPGLRWSVNEHLTRHFQNAEVIPVLIILITNGIYALVRPKERTESGLFFFCALAWWIGYLSLTKFGGIRLGPPFRLESWSGILGVLIILVVYLIRQKNRAALMLCLYGVLGGGIAFALGVFVRHPVRVSWGPFADWGGAFQWKLAEESFGLFMGLAIALGILRFAREGLAPADEDAPSKRLDIFSAFFMLAVVMWLNLQAVPEALISRSKIIANQPLLGLMPMTWFALAGCVMVALILYALYLYWRDALSIAPSSVYAKGVAVILLLMWGSNFGGFVQMLPNASGIEFPLVESSFILFVTIATLMILSRRDMTPLATLQKTATVSPSDPRWNVGLRYGLVWACVPVILFSITRLSMGMQDGEAQGARLRFGPNAYYHKAERIINRWQVIGHADRDGGVPAPSGDAPFSTIEFKENRSVTMTLPNGERDADNHSWGPRDSVIWLQWYDRKWKHPYQVEVPMSLTDDRLYIPWPPQEPRKDYWVLKQINGK